MNELKRNTTQYRQVKTFDQCMMDRPVLIDNKIMVIKNGNVWEVKVNDKGECVYYESNL